MMLYCRWELRPFPNTPSSPTFRSWLSTPRLPLTRPACWVVVSPLVSVLSPRLLVSVSTSLLLQTAQSFNLALCCAQKTPTLPFSVSAVSVCPSCKAPRPRTVPKSSPLTSTTARRRPPCSSVLVGLSKTSLLPHADHCMSFQLNSSTPRNFPRDRASWTS